MESSDQKQADAKTKIPYQDLRKYCYFSCLSDKALEALSEKLTVVEYPAGTDIVREGEPGDSFYFINKGELEVRKKTSFRGQRGKKAVLSLLGQGEVFGEMALITSSSRFATVTAKTDVILYKLSKADFEEIVLVDSTVSNLLKSSTQSYSQFNRMKTLEPFVHLHPDQISVLMNKMEEKTFKNGEDIITQGEKGDIYYVIKSGSAVVLKKMLEEEPQKVAVLTEYEAFGEEALLTGAPRSATVRARGETVVWALSKEDFDDALKSRYLEEVSPEKVELEKIGEDSLLDVRTKMEFDDEHIPGALNIPLDELRKKYSALDHNREYYVYCLVGARSSIASFLLKMHGFHAKSIQGGLLNWPGPVEEGTDGVHAPLEST